LAVLPAITLAAYPGVPFSTTKPPTLPSSSRAQTITRSAKEALPIQRLAPSSTQWSPSRRARVSRATASEPCSGSVSPKAPIFSILAMAGSQRRFCSSSPSRAMEVMASPEWTPKKVQMLPSPRPSSMPTRPAATVLSPGQP
jgi:hypothetical protein